MLACSDNMFVHNNSKHGRKSRKVESAYGRFLFKCDEIKEMNRNINNMLSFISNHAKTLSVVIFMLQMLSVLSNIMLLIVLIKYLFVFCSLSMYQGYLSQWGMDNWRNKCCSNRRKLFWWSTSGVWLTNCLEWGNIWFIWWDSKGWGDFIISLKSIIIKSCWWTKLSIVICGNMTFFLALFRGFV